MEKPKKQRGIMALEFDQDFVNALPETYALLRTTKLEVHPAVSRIVLHGSRGLSNNYRADSDFDLSLLVENPFFETQNNLETLLRSVLDTTLNSWQSSIEADLDVIFDTRNCLLSCFSQSVWSETICAT